ncbi:hypothetical protein [Yersinia phage MHG19]|nr:hypothetical protein [Yersinia phage MHG19]
MQKTKWYKLRENCSADFISNAPVTNKAIYELIGEEAFKVCEISTDDNVTRIGLYVDGVYSTYELSDIVAERLHSVILSSGEFNFFEETEMPIVRDKEEKYLIFVSNCDSTYVVGPTDNPQMFTKEDAEAHIEFVLGEVPNPEAFCQLFKLDATYVTEMKIVKK